MNLAILNHLGWPMRRGIKNELLTDATAAIPPSPLSYLRCISTVYLRGSGSLLYSTLKHDVRRICLASCESLHILRVVNPSILPLVNQYPSSQKPSTLDERHGVRQPVVFSSRLVQRGEGTKARGFGRQ